MAQFVSHRFVAFLLWITALLILILFGAWHIYDVQVRSEKALALRANQVAKQLSALLSIPGWNLDITVARPIVFTSMRDPEIYAVKILADGELLEGQRRNENGELDPWDGQLIEQTVQAISTIFSEGEKTGSVEVYLRVNEMTESLHNAWVLEIVRFVFGLFFVSACLLLYLISNGDLPEIVRTVREFWNRITKKQVLLSSKHKNVDGLERFVSRVHALCNFDKAAKYYHEHPNAMYVTAELFKKTFANTPMLLARLHTEKNFNELLYIAHLIEQAAPCIGAFTLQEKAIEIQKAYNRTDSFESNLTVESCINTLDQVLNELTNNKKKL